MFLGEIIVVVLMIDFYFFVIFCGIKYSLERFFRERLESFYLFFFRRCWF